MSAVLTCCAVHMLNSDYYSSQANPTQGNQKSPARREARDETIIKMKVIRKAVHQNDRRLFTPARVNAVSTSRDELLCEVHLPQATSRLSRALALQICPM